MKKIMIFTLLMIYTFSTKIFALENQCDINYEIKNNSTGEKIYVINGVEEEHYFKNITPLIFSNNCEHYAYIGEDRSGFKYVMFDGKNLNNYNTLNIYTDFSDVYFADDSKKIYIKYSNNLHTNATTWDRIKNEFYLEGGLRRKHFVDNNYIYYSKELSKLKKGEEFKIIVDNFIENETDEQIVKRYNNMIDARYRVNHAGSDNPLLIYIVIKTETEIYSRDSILQHQ